MKNKQAELHNVAIKNVAEWNLKLVRYKNLRFW